MRKMQHISNQTELEQLIERYFDGKTTVQEERELRAALAGCSWSSEIIDEALFTMGYFTTHKQQQRRPVKALRRHVMGIAASIAVILAVGAFALWHHQPQADDNLCIAYVNGKAITNEEAVMSLIESDLNTMGEASDGMMSQLTSLGEALELDNN